MLSAKRKEKIVDDCLARLADGASLEQCLQLYPDHANELRPILEMAAAVRMPRVSPSAGANERIKAAMLVAYNENKEIEKSPVSYSGSARYTGRRQQLEYQTRRRTIISNRSIFSQLAGAAIALILVAAVGFFVYQSMNTTPQSDGTTATVADTNAETVAETADPTALVTVNVPALVTAEPIPLETPTISSEVIGGNSDEPLAVEVQEEGPGLSIQASPNEQWMAIAETVDTEGSATAPATRAVTLTVKNANEGLLYTPIAEMGEMTMESTEPYIFGWSPDSQYLYFAETSFADGCEILPTYYVNLSRINVTTGEIELLHDEYLADVSLSPSGTELALMRTYWRNNFAEEDYNNVTVDVLDMRSAEMTSSTTIFDKAEIFVGGTLNNRLHWSDDGSRLVAELHENACPLLGGEHAFQLINPDGESPLLISSADFPPSSVVLRKKELTATQLLLVDEANPCEYAVDLASKRITSETCPDSLSDTETTSSESPYKEMRRPVSVHGLWNVSQIVNEPQDGLSRVQLRLSSQETDVTHTLIDEMRDEGMGGFALPAEIGWALDGQYFYFADELQLSGCEGVSVFNGLRRVDVTTGAIEMLYSNEMADIKLSPNFQKIAILSRSVALVATEFDTNSGDILAETPFAFYLDGGASNKLHWSSNSESIVAELNTSPCPAEGGDTDFWLLNGPDDASQVFGSQQIESAEQPNAQITANGFEENILQLIDLNDSCVFDIDVSAGRGKLHYTSCSDRIDPSRM